MKIHLSLCLIKNMMYRYIQWKLSLTTDKGHITQSSQLGFQSHIQAFSHMHSTTFLSNRTDIYPLILNTLPLLVRVKEKLKKKFFPASI